MQRVGAGLRHGNGERHGSLWRLSTREWGAGRKRCQQDEGSTVDHDAPSLGDFPKGCQGGLGWWTRLALTLPDERGLGPREACIPIAPHVGPRL